ncbi:hypothetical protein [Sphingomonas sp. KR3-1]|uniref:hypothetical protein n=1 Tax=Sphingomonas sp. KR3-1 TaxID=3156611 RepID=UPI0032B3F8B6
MMLTLAAMIGGFAAQAAPASPPLAEVLPRAAAFCGSMTEAEKITTPNGAELYAPDNALPVMSPGVASRNRSIKPLSTAPALVQRFIATGQASRPYRVDSAFRFPAASGEAWVILYSGAACDLFVTGSAQPLDPLVQALATGLEGQGWRTLRYTAATTAMPLSQRVMLQTAPKPGAAAHGTRAMLQWLAPAVAQSDGVQLEINYMSGDIAAQQPAPAQKP